jgi:hypothetical protein
MSLAHALAACGRATCAGIATEGPAQIGDPGAVYRSMSCSAVTLRRFSYRQSSEYFAPLASNPNCNYGGEQ